MRREAVILQKLGVSESKARVWRKRAPSRIRNLGTESDRNRRTHRRGMHGGEGGGRREGERLL